MIQLGRRHLISVEAAKEWRQKYSIKMPCGGEK